MKPFEDGLGSLVGGPPLSGNNPFAGLGNGVGVGGFNPYSIAGAIFSPLPQLRGPRHPAWLDPKRKHDWKLIALGGTVKEKVR